MDSITACSDNGCVKGEGFLRWQLGRTLRAAYASGLLTRDTFVHRIDHLYGAARVDPEQVVGDLAFRTRGGMWRRLRAVAASVPRRRRSETASLPLLGLDWSGTTPELLIGRGSNCDLVLDDPEVSRRHAQLFFREGKWILMDLRSTNGTYINGTRVRRSELIPGDVLALGNARLQVD